ncbi:MAG: homocysteine S-methyltransferase family protein [Candidatus Eremiobacterota bacterium]
MKPEARQFEGGRAPLTALLALRACLLLDSAMGTRLLARGLPPGHPPELWNLERPDEVAACHRENRSAGAEAVHTNTFGGSPLRLARFGLGARCREVNQRAVELARRAGSGYVLGDVGPSGLYLPPVGQAEPDELRDSFAEQAAALVAAGVDGLHVETMSDVREASLALGTLRGVCGDLPVVVSLAFERKKRGFFTAMGDPAAAALQRLQREGAVAVGANCGLISRDMAELASELLSALDAPLVLQPNAGQPDLCGDGVEYSQSATEFAADLAPVMSRLAAAGGCCGTTPDFIASIKRARAW